MIYSELRRQILNLGFETSETYEEEASIIPDALNLAMRDITNLFPLIDRYEIAQYPLPNLLQDSESNQNAKHYDGTPLVYTARGAKSFYFECSGTGALTVKDSTGERIIQLISNRVYKEYRGFASGNLTLTFSGEYSYDIKNIAIYGEKYSDKIEDIPPYRRYIRYNFRELTKIKGNVAATPPSKDIYTFIDFTDKILEGDFSGGESYKSVQDFKREQPWTLVLNGFEKAQYTIFYKKNFIPFTVDTKDSFEIELPFEKQHLLPLLASYYIWLDDDDTKATVYYNKFISSVNALVDNLNEPMAVIESSGDI